MKKILIAMGLAAALAAPARALDVTPLQIGLAGASAQIFRPETRVMGLRLNVALSENADVLGFDAGLMDKPRWLLLNKADLLTHEDAQAQAELVVSELGWTAPWFIVSGLAHEGTREVMVRVQSFLDELDREEREAAMAGPDAPTA